MSCSANLLERDWSTYGEINIAQVVMRFDLIGSAKIKEILKNQPSFIEHIKTKSQDTATALMKDLEPESREGWKDTRKPSFLHHRTESY